MYGMMVASLCVLKAPATFALLRSTNYLNLNFDGTYWTLILFMEVVSNFSSRTQINLKEKKLFNFVLLVVAYVCLGSWETIPFVYYIITGFCVLDIFVVISQVRKQKNV
eukprot:TRINITY_DN63744_c0_g1_i1.p3 TRINITY_DN63744_c0_g1~~TRINITY_DN63744_c0_g1_i1.p3  ORF type:complete len:109 (-),score=7.37 TRINITY_DN63744_c0_g1_i1:16-342(-)